MRTITKKVIRMLTRMFMVVSVLTITGTNADALVS
jgi:hypothetical protein